jgi:hypothetical protein
MDSCGQTRCTTRPSRRPGPVRLPAATFLSFTPATPGHSLDSSRGQMVGTDPYERLAPTGSHYARRSAAKLRVPSRDPGADPPHRVRKHDLLGDVTGDPTRQPGPVRSPQRPTRSPRRSCRRLRTSTSPSPNCRDAPAAATHRLPSHASVSTLTPRRMGRPKR